MQSFLMLDLQRLGKTPEWLAEAAQVDDAELRRLLDTGKGSPTTIRKVFSAMNVTAISIPSDSQVGEQ